MQVGDEVVAFYTPEALWYPAKLTGVFESADSVYYSVVFTGYNEEETIWPKHLRAQVASSFESQSDGGAAGWLTKKCTHRNQRPRLRAVALLWSVRRLLAFPGCSEEFCFGPVQSRAAFQ